MAVLLPFEVPIWRAAGVDAHYVGHPALETTPLDRDTARRALGMTPYAATVGILPGSRPHRGASTARCRCSTPTRSSAPIEPAVDARVLVAPSLDDGTRQWLRDLCAARRVGTFHVDPHVGAMGVLRAFDTALCASGTASLEAALARAVPVVAYRVGVTTELAARLLVTTPNVALPNVLLGRRAFTELLQRDAQAPRIAQALADALDRRPALVAACDEVEASLGNERTPSLAVARMLSPWLGVRARSVRLIAPAVRRDHARRKRQVIAQTPGRGPARPASLSAALLAVRLIVLRLYAATRIGFGDSEALYAAYANHPQPAYLDHPGMIGLVARALGGGTAPEPARAHVVTALLATAVPWAMALLCRACGASWTRSLGTGIVLARGPEIAIGPLRACSRRTCSSRLPQGWRA